MDGRFSLTPLIPSIYDDPKKNTVAISLARRGAKNLFFHPGDYKIYIQPPFSKRAPKEVPQHVRIYWEVAAKEIISASRLLPTSPPIEYLVDTQIDYKGFARKDPIPYISAWYFFGQYNFISKNWRGKYANGEFSRRILIREIDVTSCFSGPSNAQIWKELYLLHFFEHENLQHSLGLTSDPYLFRICISLPLSIPIIDLESPTHLRVNWQKRPYFPYIPICILRALEYLHQRDIVHRNVKIGNCTFDLDGNILLGGFEKVEISDVEAEKSKDIWDLGTTLLDFIFQDNAFGTTFPNSTTVTRFESLVQQLNLTGRNSNNGEEDNEFFSPRRPFDSFIPENSRLFDFLDHLLRVNNRPTAKTLLEEYSYIAATQLKFTEYKNKFIRYLTKNPPPEVPELMPFEILPPPKESKNKAKKAAKEPLPKLEEEKVPCSHYEKSLENAKRKFKYDAKIKATFTLISDVHDPVDIPGSFVVGEEDSMFKLLMLLLQLVSEPKELPQANDNPRWTFINVTNHLFEEWDVFRLRAALHSMLAEAANRDFDENEQVLFETSEFILCNHAEKLERRVRIEIQYSPQDIINI